MTARVLPLFQTVDDDQIDELIDRHPDHDVRGALAREVRTLRRQLPDTGDAA